jgi:hypothetical protein
VKTIKISEGIVDVLVEALSVAATRYDEETSRRSNTMKQARASFFRKIQHELNRALQDGAEYPGCICCGYETAQRWHLP